MRSCSPPGSWGASSSLPASSAGSRTGAADPVDRSPRGRLYAGTSGFSYAAWAPLFYPAGTRGDGLLRHYAGRLPAVELNNTFYQHPKAARVEAWLDAAPLDFRFAVKAQKGGSIRAIRAGATATVPWLTAPYRWFGERLGSVLFRIPGELPRDDAALAALLDAWPAGMPLVVEFQHPSWQDDTVHQSLRDHGAVLCATDLDEDPFPADLRLTGSFLYLRLRRRAYSPIDLERWAARLEPFRADGRAAFVFFRHDDTGESALHAERLLALAAAGT